MERAKCEKLKGGDGMKPETIYVATRLSDTRPAHLLINGGIAIRAGIEVAKKGHYPFIPPLDYLMYLMMSKEELAELGEQYYYKYSLVFLSKCDSIVIVNGLEDSKGVQGEYEFAKKNGLKVYMSIEEIPDVKD